MTEEYLRDVDFVEKAEDKGFEKETLNLGTFLRKLRYPITRSRILSEARKQNMHDDMIQFIKKISDRSYDDAEDVMGEITGASLPVVDDTSEPSQ